MDELIRELYEKLPLMNNLYGPVCSYYSFRGIINYRTPYRFIIGMLINFIVV